MAEKNKAGELVDRLLSLPRKLADLAELEQLKAATAEAAAWAPGTKANFQAVKLGERDRHIARAGAFLEAARLALGREP